MTRQAQLEASATALARETVALGEWQPLARGTVWSCECGNSYPLLPHESPGGLLVCEECERCSVFGDAGVRRVGFATTDPERLAGILVWPTDAPEELQLSTLVDGLDAQRGRLYYRSASPSDLRPLIDLLESLRFEPQEGDGSVSWALDVGRERDDVLRVMPRAFTLVQQRESEVLDGHGLDIGVNEERVWVSRGDQALLSMSDDERIGTWVSLTVFTDKVAFWRALASAEAG